MASTTLYKYNPATSSTNEYKGTFSWWMKVSEVDAGSYLISQESGQERFFWYISGGSDSFEGAYRGASGQPNIDFSLSSAPKIRDPNGWYHCVIAYDTTQSTASDRLKFYINNVQYTVSNVGGDIPQNTIFPMNKSSFAQPLYIGSYVNSAAYFDGLMSHFHFVDGQQLTPSSFGEYDANGVWKIKTSPSVTYGNFGYFILKNGNSVTDQSGNGNNFTVAGGTLTNTEDSPSNVFATANPLNKTSNIFLGNGNLGIGTTNTGTDEGIAGTIAFDNGKYYWENKYAGSGDPAIGIVKITANNINLNNERIIYHENGTIYTDGLSGVSAINTGVTYTTNDIISVAFDTENGIIKFYKNNSLVETITNSQLQYTNNEWIPFWYCANSNNNIAVNANFGNGYFGTTPVASAGTNASGIGIFEYDVPTGYTALSTKGLNE